MSDDALELALSFCDLVSQKQGGAGAQAHEDFSLDR